jgi:tetratricopeptide (TPR) repeat protein
MERIKKKNSGITKEQKNFLLLMGYNYIKSNKLEKAIVIYKAMYHLYPESDIFSFCLSYLYIQSKQYEKALFYAETYVSEKKGALRQGLFLKSKALFELGFIDEAHKSVKHYFSKNNSVSQKV